MKTHVWLTLLMLALPFDGRAADASTPDLARDREMRDRYETVLLRNPFQERSFNAVYEGYAKVEGVEAWVEKLKPLTESGTNSLTALLLLGQVYDRQFKSAEAIAAFEHAEAKGEARAQFKILLGSLYYKSGKDEPAAKLLAESLDASKDLDLDQRSSVCRMLGNLYLRQGKRDEAIAAWKRIAELNPGDALAQTELAEIYQDNRLWDEAVAVYRRIADASKDDPYRRCRALRSTGECLVQAEKHKEAIVTFEEALGLVSPGTWLFDDLAIRLIGVYEDLGDLSGLAKYLQARLEQSPNDADYRSLLAETYTRMGQFDLAEQEHRAILERSPRNTAIHEKLVALYARQEKTNEVVASLEKLISLFPRETDYVRRLGEAHLRAGDRTKAIETWQRLVTINATGERYVELAGWLEGVEFTKEAMAAYEQALQRLRNKEWVFRLATLKFKTGAEADAVKLWLSVLDPQKSKAPDYVEVATILEANQKSEAAGDLRKRAMELAPADLELRLAYARNLMLQRKCEEALSEFTKLSQVGDNDYLRSQGERGRLDAYAELGLLAEKRSEWERELEANPNSPKHLAQLAQLYDREGQREKAIGLYERRRSLEPANTDFLRDLAEAYKSARKEPQAIAAYKVLAEKDKGRARAYLKNLLDLYLAADAKTEAIATAEKMVDLAPSDAEAHLDLAQVYLLYRDTNKGLEQHRAAIRLKPSESEYHRQYGEALANELRWGEAQDAYRKAFDSATDDDMRLTLVQSLARIHLQQGKLDDLVSEFSRRVRNTPKRPAAYEELAAIHQEAGQTDKALQVLEDGLALLDDKVPALRALIRAAYEARDLAKVRNYFEQLIALSGRPTVAEYERLAGLYSRLGEREKARETWTRVLEMAGNDTKTIRRAAMSMRKDSFTTEATAALTKVIELDEYDYRTRFELAQMFSAEGQPARALEQLQRILELGEPKEPRRTPERRFARGARSTANPFSLFMNPQSGTRIISSGGSTYLVPPGGGSPIPVSGVPSSPPQIIYQGVDRTLTLTNAPGSPPPTSVRKFQIGDAISVTLSDIPGTQAPLKFDDKVKEDGTVTLHLGKVFKAEGKTALDLQKEIEKFYVPGYYRRITVRVLSSGPSGVAPSTTVSGRNSGITVTTNASGGGFVNNPSGTNVTMTFIGGSSSGSVGSGFGGSGSISSPGMTFSSSGSSGGGPIVTYSYSGPVQTLSSLPLTSRLVSTVSGNPGGATWQGTFDEFKPQVILQAVNLAKTTGKDESFLKSYQDRAAKEPGNVQMKRDLLMVLLACNRTEDALKLADELVAAAPDDFDLLQGAAQLFASRGRNDRAIGLYEQLLKAGPQYKAPAMRGLVSLYFQSGQEAKGEALVNEVIVLGQNDYPTLMTLGSALQQARRLDLARSVYRKGLEGDPANRKNLLYSLANLNRQDGQTEEAVNYYKQILMEPDVTSSTRSVSIYSPARLPTQSVSASASPVVRIRSIPPTVIGMTDSMKLNALSQLLTMQQSRSFSTNIITQLEREARRFQYTTNQSQRAQYWELGKMLCAHYLSDNDYDAAAEFLRFFRAYGLENDEWFNLMLYLENRKDNYAGMVPYYELLEKSNPSRAREIGVAKVKALTLGRHWEDAARLMSELPQPLPASEFIALAQPLAQANQNKLLRPLIEERLSFGTRDPELVAMLGRACAAEGDYDRAIELAEEAWQARSRSRASPSGGSNMTVLSGTASALVVNPGAGSDIDAILRDMHRYYSARGKRAELLIRFEQRLKDEPDSQRAYESLAQIYRLDGQTDKAMETYRKLLEKFSRSVPARLAMASYQVDRGDTTSAIQLYEELRRTNPEMATQIDAWLRTLRQRATR